MTVGSNSKFTILGMVTVFHEYFGPGPYYVTVFSLGIVFEVVISYYVH